MASISGIPIILSYPHVSLRSPGYVYLYLAKLQLGLLKNSRNILRSSVGSFEVEDLGAGLKVAHVLGYGGY